MEIIFSKAAQKDLKYWVKSHNSIVQARIEDLLRDIMQHPLEGIGNPEPLKHDLSGCWSRKITGEHRLVYRVADDVLEVISCRFHY